MSFLTGREYRHAWSRKLTATPLMSFGLILLAVLRRLQQVELLSELKLGEMFTGMAIVPDQPEPSRLGQWFVGPSAQGLQSLLREAWTENLQVGIGSSKQVQEVVARVALRGELGLAVAAVRKPEDTA